MHITLFAQTPPPTHGQSLTMKLLLDALAKDTSPNALIVHHVNARFSDDIRSIARLQPQKLFRLLKFCLQAIWFRFRFKSKVLVYVPAPGMRTPIYRDWLVMLMCRPFYRRRVYYWQAGGLGAWLEKNATPIESRLTHLLLAKPDLSILPGNSARADATALKSGRIVLVPNAIEDPCPDFTNQVLPVRRARLAARLKIHSDQRSEPVWFEVLFLSLCTREKGLFDAMEAVQILNSRLDARKSGVRARLTVAGKFWLEREELEFRQKASEANASHEILRYVGFADATLKQRLFLHSDCFCFPTFYPAETFGLVLLEAMAWGVPTVASDWRNIPEVLPSGYRGIVPARSPTALAAAMEEFVNECNGEALRNHFLQHFRPEHLISKFKVLIHDLE